MQRIQIWTSKASKKSRLSYLIGLAPSIILWEMWISRNQARYEGFAMSSNQILFKINPWLNELGNTISAPDRDSMSDSISLKTLKINEAQPLPPRKLIIINWSKPPPGWLKLNVDGSSRGNPGSSGGGGICRDHHGNLIFAFHRSYGQSTNTLAEAQAMLDGLKICSNLGLSNIIVETDSMTIFKSVVDPSFSSSWQIWYTIGAIQLFQRSLNLIFSHIHREGNSVADALARLASEGCPNRLFESRSTLPRQVQGNLIIDKIGIGNIRFL